MFLRRSLLNWECICRVMFEMIVVYAKCVGCVPSSDGIFVVFMWMKGSYVK